MAGRGPASCRAACGSRGHGRHAPSDVSARMGRRIRGPRRGMTVDKYADLRAALADAQSADGDWVLPVVEVDTIRALLADYDRMRDARASIIDIAARPAVIDIARAAIAQKQGGSDAT